MRFPSYCSVTFSVFLLAWVLAGPVPLASAAPVYQCQPTPEDELGPLYKPDAPVRNSVGEGYLLIGKVKSATDCATIKDAKIEIWLAGPAGIYGEAWRATLYSAANGSYHFTSHVPPGYGTGRPHIHIKVSAPGHQTLITQHYPIKDAGIGQLDLVLIPAE